jgi:hypothetical protein
MPAQPVYVPAERPGLPEGPPPAKKNKGGHPKDPLLDEFLEVDEDQVVNVGQPKNVSRCTQYCRFCHKASAARDGPRAKKHAAFDCPNIPDRLREKVMDDMVKRSPQRLPDTGGKVRGEIERVRSRRG